MIDGSPPSNVVSMGATLSDAHVVVVAVHGRDESPDTIRVAVVEPVLLELAARHVDVDPDRIAWLLPEAPAGRWYPESFLAPAEVNAAALTESLGAMATLDAELARIDAGRLVPQFVVWVGFSQGACLVTEHLARHERTSAAAGLFAFTGCLVGPRGTTITAPGELGEMYAYFGFGERDELIADWRVEETAAAFERRGAVVVVDRFDDDAHVVRPAEIDALATFIERLLDVSKDGESEQA